MAKQYRLEKAALGDSWDSFVETSPDSTVFVTSEYLANTACRLGLYHCYNVDELRAAVALIENEDGSSAILDDLVIYSGVFFGPPMNGQNRSQQISERFEMLSFLADELVDKYVNIEFALSPTVSDIRPLLWHNYGQDKNRYTVDVRYTSLLDISDFSPTAQLEDIQAYVEASSARRQQIRYARRDKVVTEEFTDVGLFIEFYRQTMQRQGEAVEGAMLDRMGSLVKALMAAGLAKMFISRTSDGIPGSIAVYAIDTCRAYYLFGASDPELRGSPTGTAALWDAFHSLAGLGVKQIDLEGVNSPKRGWFKLSFGGELNPYFQVGIKNSKLPL